MPRRMRTLVGQKLMLDRQREREAKAMNPIRAGRELARPSGPRLSADRQALQDYQKEVDEDPNY